MKALVLREAGKWREMKVEEISIPSIKNNEVLVRVHAAGLNPVDYKTATNGNKNWIYPHVLGLDVAGTIEEVGTDVTGWQKGDRVVYHGDLTQPHGGFAQYAVATAHTISRIPNGVTFEEAAALPTAGYTAYQALFRKLHIEKGQSILIHAGAGGVGGIAIQLAKQHGLTVYTTASCGNKEYVTSLGADVVIDYREKDFVEEIMTLTNGQGIKYVLDSVSRDNATKSLEVLHFNGSIAHIAGAPDYTAIPPFTKALSYHEIALGAVYSSKNDEEQKDLARMGDVLLRLIEEKKISALLEEVISLEEVPQALERLAERHVRGKIVARINEKR